jgi:hypothetical protein
LNGEKRVSRTISVLVLRVLKRLQCAEVTHKELSFYTFLFVPVKLNYPAMLDVSIAMHKGHLN